MTNLNFEVIEIDGEKSIRIHHIDQDLIKNILKDEYGHEYFTVPNYFNGPGKTVFMCRPYDAYKTVMAGDGDMAVINGPHLVTVRYYLDRDIGSDIRNKFLKYCGFKEENFFYYIRISSNFCDMFIAEDLSLGSNLLSNYSPYKKFKSDDEARALINKIIAVGESFANMDDKTFEKEYNEKDPIHKIALMLINTEKTPYKFDKSRLHISQSYDV